MKKLLFTISIAAFQYCGAQVTLVGMSSHGGFGNHGTIYSINTAGSLDTLFNFKDGLNGCSPMGNLVQDADGNLYGVTASCGSNGGGTLFKYNKKNHAVTTLVNFSVEIGGGPLGSLTFGSDGNLYGMTNVGGANSAGTIFKCSTDGVLTILESFGGKDGANPVGSLKEGADGNFYGMTRMGGEFNKGVVFKYSPFGMYTVLHSFNGLDGAAPQGDVALVKDSILYGVTTNGGTYNGGAVFSCSTSGKFQTLNSFNSSTGTTPFGSLLNAEDGYLYGTTYASGANYFGTLFRCDYNGKISVLTNFDNTNGANPMSTLAMASDGNIYGTTSNGGSTKAQAGVIFRYNTTSNLYTTIYQFDENGPQSAQGGVIEMISERQPNVMAAAGKATHKHTMRKTSHGKTGTAE